MDFRRIGPKIKNSTRRPSVDRATTVQGTDTVGARRKKPSRAPALANKMGVRGQESPFGALYTPCPEAGLASETVSPSADREWHYDASNCGWGFSSPFSTVPRRFFREAFTLSME